MSASIIPLRRVPSKPKIVRQPEVGMMIQYRLCIMGVREPITFTSFNNELAIQFAFEHLQIPVGKRNVTSFKNARGVGVYRLPSKDKIYPPRTSR